jgi:hypothetical protein
MSVLRRIAPVILLAALGLAVVARVGEAPDPWAGMSGADRLRSCADAGGAGPSFCVTLPAPALADRGTLLASRRTACGVLQPGEAPDFCLVVPSNDASTAALRREIALADLRQRLGGDFRRTTAAGLQLWTEVGLSPEVAAGVLRGVVTDAAAVEDYFGRSYRERPAVFLFTSRRSFALALERHFAVSPAEAGQLSRQLLGLLLTGSDAVAINGENVVTSVRPIVYRHELAHVLIHQLAGDGVSAWLDEGLATRISALDPAVIDPARAEAIALLRTDRRVLAIFTDRRDWQTINAAYNGRAYGVAAEAVLEIERRVGRAGVTTVLEALGQHAALEETFQATTGETLDDFVARLPSTVCDHCEAPR